MDVQEREAKMGRDHEFEVQDRRIHCDGCESRIKHALGRIEGVTAVEANHETQRVRVSIADGGPLPEQIARKLADIGFPALPRP
jgi:copper chaperone CopZ